MSFARRVEYRLYPSSNQALELTRTCDICRQVFNWALAERRDHYEKTQKTLSFAEQCRRLTIVRRTNFTWKSVHTHALQIALKRLDIAFSNFFRRIKIGYKSGFPRFKSRNRFSGFGFKEHGNGWRLESNAIRLTGIGRIKMRGQSRFTGTVPKICDLIQRAGKWYLSVTYLLADLPHRERMSNLVTGLDWGVTTFATLANDDGTSEDISNPRHLRKQLANLAIAQQKFAHKTLGSRRQWKARGAITRLHDKVRRQRQNFLHQTTSKLISSRQVIVIEKLSINTMTASKDQRKAGLNREILAAAAGAFHSMLRYKAEEAGTTIIEIDPRIHKSSQTCSGGGVTRKKSLAERSHVLPDGSVISRDLNAARNLLNLALGREPTQHSGPSTGLDTVCEIAPIAK